MTSATLPAGFTMRTPVESDAAAVTAALAASRSADGDREPELDEILTDWAEVDLNEEAVVICEPEGRIVAGADVLNRRYTRVSVYGYVHPAWRGMGIGRALVLWGEQWVMDRIERAPDGSRIVIDHFVLSTASATRELLVAMGYAPVRTTLVMRRLIPHRPHAQIPPGTSIRAYVPGTDDQALFDAGEAAFADTWGHPPGTLESWLAGTRAAGFDPALWLLAEETSTGKVVGVCAAQIAGGEGWIRTLGVRPEARKRGLGLALLQSAFAVLYERGVRAVELSVDAQSPTHAPRVYERAGMSVERTFILHQKELRAGKELSSLG
jgi:mycothiol synthase